ncbi:peroxiredoxin-like family protein [Haladaptatus sp. DJG-WS-42]|uniref:peroxiredoxin-like family protein n=1 Tax=Haladaptatus sp. DJG-WS-42 TaxID=3120516 RepID=UPI0030CFE9D6
MSSEYQQIVDDAEHEWRTSFDQGPTRTRWTVLPVQIGDNAPDFTLPDQQGNERTLSEFWTGSPALVLFWRHFGCRCSIERAARLKAELAAYDAAGGTVVIVGQGDPERAAAYAREHDIVCPILCDTSMRAYSEYGLLEGQPSQIIYGLDEAVRNRDPAATDALVEARRREGRPLVDNPWQLPGEFIIAENGRIQLAYRYQYCEDFPDPRIHETTLQSLTRTESDS